MNIAKMMKQAQELKEKMEEAQSNVNDLSIEGSARDGSVVVTIRGSGAVESVHIEPNVLSAFPDMVGDLVVMASKNAFSKLEDEKKRIMGHMPGGMPF
jgi:nucleoid-associated protein EbfC